MKFSLSRLFKKTYTPRVHTPVILQPTYVWHRIIFMSIILTFIAGGLSWYLYLQIVHDQAFQAQPEKNSGTDLIKHTKLDDVLKEYREREATFKELQITKPSIIDPSL